MNKKSTSSRYTFVSKLVLFIVTLCMIATSIAVYAKGGGNNSTSGYLELILNESEIEFVNQIPDAEFYVGAKQLFSDSTQDIIDPISVVWSTSDSRVAEIKDNGAIIPKSPGNEMFFQSSQGKLK